MQKKIPVGTSSGQQPHSKPRECWISSNVFHVSCSILSNIMNLWPPKNILAGLWIQDIWGKTCLPSAALTSCWLLGRPDSHLASQTPMSPWWTHQPINFTAPRWRCLVGLLQNLLCWNTCAIYFEALCNKWKHWRLCGNAEIHVRLYIRDDRSQLHEGHKNTAIPTSLATWAIKAHFLQACLS